MSNLSTTEAPTKWITGVSPATPTADVATLALRARLAAIRLYLPLAATRAAEDIEHVHQLRVWSRRGAAAFEVFAECLPRRRAAWVKRQLKRLRRAANEARDLDVILLRLGSGEATSQHAAAAWLNKLRSQRDAAQAPLIAIHKRLKRGGRFDRRAERLIRRVRLRDAGEQPDAAAQFGGWAESALRRNVADFLAAVPNDDADLHALHAFRIRGKQLRYAIELLAAAFPAPLVEELYPIIETMQTKLGELNDAVTLRGRLLHWIGQADDPAEVEYLHTLLSQEQARLAPLRQEFLAWSGPQLDRLRDGFARLDGSVKETPAPDR